MNKAFNTWNCIVEKLYQKGVEQCLEELINDRESNSKRLIISSFHIPDDDDLGNFYLHEHLNYLDLDDEFYELLNEGDDNLVELHDAYWNGYRDVFHTSELKERVLFELYFAYSLKKLSTKAKHPLFEPALIQYIQKFVKIPEDIYHVIKDAHDFQNFPGQRHYCQLIKY